MDDCDSADLNTHRNNMDTKRLNTSGKFLIDLCKESSLRLLNGRSGGDIFGKFTCYTYNGCSLVDYAVVSAHMLCKIAKFQVHDFTSLSNHCPISCSVLSSLPGDAMGAQARLFPLPGKFLWNPVSIETYTEKVRTQETQKNCNLLLLKILVIVTELQMHSLHFYVKQHQLLLNS